MLQSGGTAILFLESIDSFRGVPTGGSELDVYFSFSEQRLVQLQSELIKEIKLNNKSIPNYINAGMMLSEMEVQDHYSNIVIWLTIIRDSP